MSKLIIFDVDGTLFNTDEIHFRMLKEELKKYSFNLTEEFYGANNLDDSIYSIGLSESIVEEVKNTIRAKYYSDEILNELKFKAGVKETLYILSKISRFAIGSGEKESQIKRYLVHKGLLDLFEFIGHGQMIEERKNNPEYFQIIADNCGVTLSDCTMVGDALHDANAIKHGCRTIIIPSVFTQHVKFPNNVQVLQSFSELPKYFSKFYC